MSATADAAPIRSTIPARLDRLRWSKFHTMMVIGLGSAGLVELAIGIKAEGKSLESVTQPLTATAPEAAAAPATP